MSEKIQVFERTNSSTPAAIDKIKNKLMDFYSNPELYLNTLNLKVSGYEKESIVDGPGIRYTIFVQGCLSNCKGCHNPQTHSLTDGEDVRIKDIYDDILSSKLVNGVTFSGGEPFLQAKSLACLGYFLKKKFNLISYSGYDIFDIWKRMKYDAYVALYLNQLDIVIEGPYVDELRTLELKFRGSKNQRVVLVKESLKQGKVIFDNNIFELNKMRNLSMLLDRESITLEENSDTIIDIINNIQDNGLLSTEESKWWIDSLFKERKRKQY